MRRTEDVLGDAPSFGDLLLPPAMVEALSAAGFVRPSPVQQAAIPVARLGADVIIQAKAGTGKTLVFAVAAVERVDLGSGLPQVLVLAPTREVALQAADVIDAVSPVASLTVATLIGGLPTAEDERVLRRACHVVVGTPGRVLALLQRGTLVAQRLQMLVLDEADRLLGDAFRGDVAAVLEALPPRRQLLALSATYTAATLHDLRALMRHPQEVQLCEESVALLGVRQFYRMAARPGSAAAAATAAAAAGQEAVHGGGGDPGYGAKLASLLDVMNSISFHQAVVFCNHKSTAEGLGGDLQAAGQAAACLSSAKSQLERIDVVNALREFRLRVVVSTDVAARGVDLDRVNLVVNFDLPAEAATYLHRVGRAGRFGTSGVAVSLLCCAEELGQLRAFLRDAAGGEVHALPDHVPADWYTSAHSVSAQELPAAPPAAAPASSVPQVEEGPSAGYATVTAPGPAAASLWPEERGPLPTTDRWPLRLADLNAAAGPGAAKIEESKSREPPPPGGGPPAARPANEREEEQEEGIDLSYTVIPSPRSGHRPQLASKGGHYAQLARSAELDLRRSVVDAQDAANLLEAAFKWPARELITPEAVAVDGACVPSATAAAAAAPSAPRAGPEDAVVAARHRRALGSVQAQAHRRQLAKEEEADALAAEAAYLEALAEAESEGGGEEGEVEEERGGSSDESAWRRYWIEHYNVHGYYPGARSAAADARPPAAPLSPPPRRAHPTALASPATSTPPPPPPPVEPPPLWASPGAGSGSDGGGDVRVPAAVLQHFQELEWADWRRRYQEWCSAFDAWKLAGR